MATFWGTLCFVRVADVPIVSLKALAWLKEMGEDFVEYSNVGILTSRVRTLDLHQVPCQDVHKRRRRTGRRRKCGSERRRRRTGRRRKRGSKRRRRRTGIRRKRGSKRKKLGSERRKCGSKRRSRRSRHDTRLCSERRSERRKRGSKRRSRRSMHQRCAAST